MPRGHTGTSSDHGTLARYKTGCTCHPCRDANRKYVILRQLDGRPGHVAPMIAARKVRALIALGWSTTQIGARLGVTGRQVWRISNPQSPAFERSTHDRVDAAYRAMCMTIPPETTKGERISAVKARRHAERNGWAPPLAWDNIDNPHETPQGVGFRKGHADPEEWLLLVRAGEDPERAATRLGVTVSAIAKAARRAGLPHIAHEADSAKRAA